MIFLSPGVLSATLALKGWSTWTPTYSTSSGVVPSCTTQQANYKVHGDFCFFRLAFLQTTPGSSPGDGRFSLPLAVVGDEYGSVICSYYNASSGTPSNIYRQGLTIGSLCIFWDHSNGPPWSSARTFGFQGTYRIA